MFGSLISPLRSSRERRRGTVLIVAMWVTLVLAGIVLVFARAIRVEIAASANHVSSVQAEAVAQGALRFVMAQVDGTDGEYTPDETVSFEAVEVGNGYFWILNPSLSDDVNYQFGIRDEASRINLNSAPSDALVKLPGMTAELAAAIIDWRDSDSDVSPGGAESEYYLLLADPYYCKDGPLETVEELLLVRDMTPAILFGEDTNRNGVLDPNENDAAETDPPDNQDGRLDRGIFDYVTVYSREPAASSSSSSSAQDGPININDTNMTQLSALIREVVSQDQYFRLMDRVRAGRPYRNVLDFYYRTGLTIDQFRQMVDRLTTGGSGARTGLVNVNTAPAEVLLCLPGLEQADVDALVSKRASPDTDLTNIAWVAEALPPEKGTAIGNLITTRSYQFSADIVAVSGDGRAFRRYRAVVDTQTSPPRVLLWQNLTHLGWPLSPDILTTLRAGRALKSQTITVGGSP